MKLITYTILNKPEKAMSAIRQHTRDIADKIGAEYIVVAPREVPEAHRTVVLPVRFTGDRKIHFDLYSRIFMAIIDVQNDEPVFLCEDDIIYPECHFHNAIPDPHTLYYNLEIVYMSPLGFFENYNRGALALHQAFGTAQTMRNAVIQKIKETHDDRFNCWEPCSRPWTAAEQSDPFFCKFFSGIVRDPVPCLDIRSGMNSGDWSVESGDFEFYHELEDWGSHKYIWDKYGF
jgi:hypothetical protein